MEILAFVLSAISSIITGMVLFFLKGYFTKKEKADEEKEKLKQRENVLILKSIDSIGKLTYANSIAIRDGKTNGELKSAIADYNNTSKELYDYLLEQNSKK